MKFLARKPRKVKALDKKPAQAKRLKMLTKELQQMKTDTTTLAQLLEVLVKYGQPTITGKEIRLKLSPQQIMYAICTAYALPIPFGNTLQKVQKQMAESDWKA